MASQIYPCKKCLINIPENLDSICCEICNQWYHVKNCSGLTLKKFKKICNQNDSVWYCTSCIKENLPFGKLGEKTFEDVLYNKATRNNKDTFLKQYIKTNNFVNTCSIVIKTQKQLEHYHVLYVKILYIQNVPKLRKK